MGYNWLADVPEAPGRNDTDGYRTLNNEGEADAGDNMPEIGNSLCGPFGLRRVWEAGCGGLRGVAAGR